MSQVKPHKTRNFLSETFLKLRQLGKNERIDMVTCTNIAPLHVVGNVFIYMSEDMQKVTI